MKLHEVGVLTPAFLSWCVNPDRPGAANRYWRDEDPMSKAALKGCVLISASLEILRAGTRRFSRRRANHLVAFIRQNPDEVNRAIGRARDLIERGLVRDLVEDGFSCTPQFWNESWDTVVKGKYSSQAQMRYLPSTGVWTWRVGRGSRTACRTIHGRQPTYRILAQGEVPTLREASALCMESIEFWKDRHSPVVLNEKWKGMEADQ